MDRVTYDWLQTKWADELPGVPWPFDLTAHPQDVITAIGVHLGVRTGRPPLRVTLGEPVVVEPRPCNTPPPGPTKAAS